MLSLQGKCLTREHKDEDGGYSVFSAVELRGEAAGEAIGKVVDVEQDRKISRASRDFHRSGSAESELRGEIVALVPALRAFSRALTRNPSEADDLLQESLLKALGHIHQFAPGTNLKAWLFTIVRNTFYTGYNKRRRESSCPLDEAISVHVAPGQEWSLKIRAVDKALQQIPVHQREALMLVGCAGLSYEEASEICGCALGTIRSRVNRARTHLLKLLEVDAHDEFLDSER